MGLQTGRHCTRWVLALVLALVLVLVLVLPLVFPCAISEMHPLRPVWSSASAKQVAG